MNNKKDIIERIDEFEIEPFIMEHFGEYTAFCDVSDETLLEDCKKEILRQRSIIDNLLKNVGE